MLKLCQWHGSLCMRNYSESSYRYETQRSCSEMNQDAPKVESLQEKITTRRMSTEISTSTLAIGANMRRVAAPICRQGYLQWWPTSGVSRARVLQEKGNMRRE